MKWRDWSLGVKGGVIGLFVTLFIFIVSFFALSFFVQDEGVLILMGLILVLPLILVFGYLIGYLFGKSIEKTRNKQYSFAYAFYGSIIGLILLFVPIIIIVGNLMVFLRFLNRPNELFLSIFFSIVIGGLVGFFIGKRKSK